MENLNSAAKNDFASMFVDLVKSIQSGEIMNNPNMLLALVLFSAAGLIIFVGVTAFLIKRSAAPTPEESNFLELESRIQALEVALLDHRNLAISMKNQNKADFSYFKQEMKNLYYAIEGLDGVAPATPRLRKASSF